MWKSTHHNRNRIIYNQLQKHIHNTNGNTFSLSFVPYYIHVLTTAFSQRLCGAVCVQSVEVWCFCYLNEARFNSRVKYLWPHYHLLNCQPWPLLALWMLQCTYMVTITLKKIAMSSPVVHRLPGLQVSWGNPSEAANHCVHNWTTLLSCVGRNSLNQPANFFVAWYHSKAPLRQQISCWHSIVCQHVISGTLAQFNQLKRFDMSTWDLDSCHRNEFVNDTLVIDWLLMQHPRYWHDSRPSGSTVPLSGMWHWNQLLRCQCLPSNTMLNSGHSLYVLMHEFMMKRLYILARYKIIKGCYLTTRHWAQLLMSYTT